MTLSDGLSISDFKLIRVLLSDYRYARPWYGKVYKTGIPNQGCLNVLGYCLLGKRWGFVISS